MVNSDLAAGALRRPGRERVALASRSYSERVQLVELEHGSFVDVFCEATSVFFEDEEGEVLFAEGVRKNRPHSTGGEAGCFAPQVFVDIGYRAADQGGPMGSLRV